MGCDYDTIFGLGVRYSTAMPAGGSVGVDLGHRTGSDPLTLSDNTMAESDMTDIGASAKADTGSGLHAVVNYCMLDEDRAGTSTVFREASTTHADIGAGYTGGPTKLGVNWGSKKMETTTDTKAAGAGFSTPTTSAAPRPCSSASAATGRRRERPRWTAAPGRSAWRSASDTRRSMTLRKGGPHGPPFRFHRNINCVGCSHRGGWPLQRRVSLHVHSGVNRRGGPPGSARAAAPASSCDSNAGPRFHAKGNAGVISEPEFRSEGIRDRGKCST